jgi:VanZ family protein
MAFLFALSSRAVPGPVSHVPDWLSHGAAYAVLAVLACRAVAGGLALPVTAGTAAGAVLISFLYGVTDEIHQAWVPGRQADPWDLAKNLAGAVAGAMACAWPRPAGERPGKAA